MKKLYKLTAFILAALMCLSFTACGEAGDYFVDAEEEYAEADGSCSNFSSTITVTGSDATSTINYTGTFLVNYDDDAYSAALNGELTAESTKIAINAYYQDGKLYSDVSGAQNYVEATFDEAMAQIGLCGFPMDLEITDFEAISMSDTDEGKQIDFVIAPAYAYKITGLESQWNRLAAISGDDATVSLKEITGSIVVDSHDRPLSEEINISGNIFIGEEVIAVTNTISNTFEVGDTQELAIPDLSAFTYIEK